MDDDLAINFKKREVIVGGQHIKLRPTEYRLLYHLVNNAGYVMTHDMLLAKVWGHEYRDESQYVRLYIMDFNPLNSECYIHLGFDCAQVKGADSNRGSALYLFLKF